MDTQTAPPGVTRSEMSRTMGISADMSHNGTEQECRHEIVQRDATNAATKPLTEDAHLKIICKTGSSQNKKQHAFGCVYIYTVVNGCQITIVCVAGVHSELSDQCLATRNRKPPGSTKICASTVRNIEHHDVVSSGFFAAKFRDKHPQVWTKQA
jgi:hypothetical protein